jgi:hypothetical protein
LSWRSLLRLSVQEGRHPDKEFERLEALQDSDNSERLVIKKEFNSEELLRED